MIQNRPCVNGIVAAVLSASIVPTHGALAKEKSHRLLKAMAKASPRPAGGGTSAAAATRSAPAQ
jgi:hypothetical protein